MSKTNFLKEKFINIQSEMKLEEIKK